MSEYNIRIPDDVYFILNRLCEYGYGAHIVGGCVRDMLIGKKPTDYDITTSATPDEVKAVFSDFRTVDTGIQHGTVTLVYSGAPYEITTYRTEGTYTDNRHPDSVSFTRDLSLDLSRRDFTVNAMCADKDGNLCDLFGGREDIASGILRAVGNPVERFTEDALRILRALRFSATLGFALEPETAVAVRECAYLLKNISVERTWSELVKLFGGKSAYEVISEYGDVIKTVLPEISEITLPPRENFLAADGAVRLASLFAIGAKTPHEDFDRAMKRLHTDTKSRVLGATALRYISYSTDNECDALKLLYFVGEECARFVLKLKCLLFASSNYEVLTAAEKSGKPYKISAMAIGGGAFVSAGFCKEEIGRAMEKTLFAIIEGKIKNDEAEIHRYIEKLKL